MKFEETDVWFAINMIVCVSVGWFAAFAARLIWAYPISSIWSQSTEANRRISGRCGLIEPCDWESLSQLAFAEAVKVNELGPPAPISMKTFPNGTKRSKVMTGVEQE